jgi:predicted ATPase/class 3 adenylate cyclase
MRETATLPASPATLSALGGYELQGLLHVGQKALVYRARKAGASGTVIVKTQRSDHPTGGALRRLRSEYDLLRDLKTPTVVQVLDFVTDGNRTVLVLEDVGGTSLRRVLDAGSLPIAELCAVGIALADALAAVHAAGVMHKDVNPSNVILLPAGGGVRLIDFDIASRAPRETRHASPPRALEGTLAYLAPEQSGRVNHTVDARADLYALGVTLFEMATGRLPFEATDPLQLVHAHIARRPVDPASLRTDLPAPVAGLILRLLEKRPEARYQSARGVAADLREVERRLTEGETLAFEIGQSDHPTRFQLPERLYGRETEIALLLSSFARAAEGRAELVLVAGDPGAGKSRLIDEVRRPIVERNGAFVSGKFDQFRRDVPFLSLGQALRALAQQLLSESPERLESGRASMRDALGANAAVLSDLVPELEALVGPFETAPELGGLEAQNRFQQALSSYVEVFCRPEHPLCLVLDDLQWADSATLLWLEHTLSRQDAHHLLIIGAFRKGEVPAGHPLTTVANRLDKRGVAIDRLDIGPLDAPTVERLVGDALLRAPAETRPLAQLVFRKTLGNPFFVHQCLDSLEEQQAILYDDAARAFAFDLAKAERAPIADDVVDFMVARLRRLEDATQAALRVAACLGNSFGLGELAAMRGRTEAEVRDDLDDAVSEGLVLRRDAVGDSEDETYVFLHDRVQQAAYALVPAEERGALHASIARSLLGRMDDPATDDALFDALGHIIAAGLEALGASDRAPTAHLFLAAAARARRSTAYEPGLRFADLGLSLCGAESDRALKRALTLERAELHHLSGNDAEAGRAFEVALSLADDPLERAAVRERQVHFHTNRADFQAAYDVGRAGCADLGVSLPGRFVPPVFVKDLVQTMLMLRKRPIDELAALPLATGGTHATAVRLIAALLKAAYQLRPELCVHNAMLAVKLSLRHGNARESPIAYLVFGGIFLGGILGKHARGNAFGRLALKLVDQLDNPWQRAEVQFVYGYFASSWLEPAREAERVWRSAWQSGVDVGDFFHAGCASSGIAQSLFMRGAPLDEVTAEIERFTPFLVRVGNRENVGTLRGIRQCIATLEDPSGRFDGFRSGGFDLDAYETELWTWGSRHFAHHFFIDKAAVCALFGDHAQARETLKRAAPLLKDSQGMLHSVEHVFWAAFVEGCLAAPGDVPSTLTQTRKRLARLAAQNPTNFAVKSALLDAEWHRLRGQVAEAAFAYERAATRAADDGVYHLEALAQERAAELHLADGRRNLARYAANEALYAWRRWGADALSAKLIERWPELVQTQRATRGSLSATGKSSHTGTTLGDTGDALDLLSVVKAAEAISSEVQLRALLARLLGLVMENAGAERGALILVEENELVLHAFAVLGEPVHIERQALSQSENVALTAVQLCARTLSAVVEDDAVSAGRLTHDPHVRAARVRSLIALPLLNRGALRAVLYLENPMVAGAFTEDRQSLLRVLSGPMAVSLDNALLYDSLERTYQATRRFVPFEFLAALGKKTIVEVQHGDHAQLEVTVMFTDLRGFTSLCEGMTPGQTYAFINAYLAHVEPCITEHGGFIQHFLGDGILALFWRSSSADDAVLSSLQLLDAVERFNAERRALEQPEVAVGIGMNTGTLMLGTIGGRERLDANVIGDAVNVAARVEGQTKYLGSVLLTDATASRLADPSRYPLREVDRVVVKGRTAPVTLFELTPRPRATQARFDLALQAYRDGQFESAGAHFEALATDDATDAASAHLARRCAQMLLGGLPPDWSGIYRLDSK